MKIKCNLSSNKLFEKDKSMELESLTDEIKSEIKIYYKDKTKEFGKLQNKLITLRNLQMYENFRLSEKDENGSLKFKIKERINLLHAKFKDYMDLSEEDFYSSFPANFMERVYELIMADFISKKFSLKERVTGKPLENVVDFKFLFNGKQYFMECTTRNSSLLDKFCELLFQLDTYLEISKIFKERLNEYDREREWHYMVENIWNNLALDQQEYVIKNLCVNEVIVLPHNRDLVIKKINEWVYYALYVLHNFPNILPEEILEKLKNLFPNSCRSEDMHKLSNFLIDSLALKVIDKLKNSYFDEGVPIIISISLSPLPGELLTHSAFTDLNLISQLPGAIVKNLDIKKGQLDVDTIRAKMVNLYAVIIDTTWYNWFPDIIEECELGKFSGEIKNCYKIIYNKNISTNISEKFIFNGMVKEEHDLLLEISKLMSYPYKHG